MSPIPAAYILCGTPRSGSTLLCEMLTATGVAGRPNSYFRHQNISDWAEEWAIPRPDGTENAEFDRSYLSAMIDAGSAGTGVFGLRLMWSSVADAKRRLDRVFGGAADIATRFEQAFGPVLFVHLSRRDKVAQAVSLLRAEQSGLWHRAADGTVIEGPDDPAPISYDAERLAALEAEFERDDTAWESFFAEHGITPERMVYESVTENPRQTLAKILSALGRDPRLAETVAIRTARLADDTSRAWIERFRSERNDKT